MRNQRGMVTAEMAVASLLLAFIAGAMTGLFGLGITQIRCTDSAAEIARQAARGDVVAVERVSRQVPAGAVVTTDRAEGAMVSVTVSAVVRPVPGLPLTATVVGRAVTPLEPGVR